MLTSQPISHGMDIPRIALLPDEAVDLAQNRPNSLLAPVQDYPTTCKLTAHNALPVYIPYSVGILREGVTGAGRVEPLKSGLVSRQLF